MTLFQIVIVIAVAGLLAWANNRPENPIPAFFKQLINALLVIGVILLVVVWLLRLAGLAGV